MQLLEYGRIQISLHFIMHLVPLVRKLQQNGVMSRVNIEMDC